ncbi:unnamed protein product [Ostreobium quekettii]|uniref:Uncharacterized protein n=1 Tax=Ostreobium quekettii TaxID=121088 RepID=A0A8S1JDM1_9CHLO|nr:unnamed protein product [Ostreobium quekettii]|eukprot:evm.model.scf_544.3 EVM.evm.TU.scf_544.3   scf_544:16087-17195(-)
MAGSLMRWFVAVVLACALCADAKIEVKYNQLPVVDAAVSVEFTSEGFEKQPLGSPEAGCPLNEDGSTCQPAPFGYDDDTVLSITFSLEAALGNDSLVNTALGDETYDPPTKVSLRACYSKPDTKLRKWRKIKAVVDDDKRCDRKIVKALDLTDQACTATSCTYDYTLPSDIPAATWFITVLFLCPIKGSDDTQFCAVDSTVGSLAELVGDGVTEDDPARSNPIYYSTEVVDSRPPEMVAGVIVLSIVAIIFLVGFFSYEKLVKKNA